MRPVGHTRDSQLSAFFVLLAIVSVLEAMYGAAVLLHITTPPQMADTELALYTGWFVAAVVSAIAIMQWKKWGVYTLALATLIVSIVTILQGTATLGGASLAALIILALIIYLPPIWNEFE